MKKLVKNYAFIDSQNLNLGIKDLGWKLDFKRFRVYLREKYGAKKAYLFIGYLDENSNMYRTLQEYGYVLIFKPILKNRDGAVKGNVDADLVLRAMIDYNEYDQAIIVTGDGDFYCLVEYLFKKHKLARLIVPDCYKYSVLLKRILPSTKYIAFMNDLRKKLEYKKTRPARTGRVYIGGST